MASLKRSVRTHFGTQAEINGWRFKDEWAPAWPLKLVTAYPSQWSSILPPPGPVFQQGCGKASGAQFFKSSSKTYRTGLVGSVQPRLLDNRGDLAFASGRATPSRILGFEVSPGWFLVFRRGWFKSCKRVASVRALLLGAARVGHFATLARPPPTDECCTLRFPPGAARFPRIEIVSLKDDAQASVWAGLPPWVPVGSWPPLP